MRAVQITSFGAPETLAVTTAPEPQPGPGEVRLTVAATAVNAVDVYTRQGGMRMISGGRLPQGVGIDAVGVVDAVGEGADQALLGRRVWGIRPERGLRTTGTAADFAVLPAAAVTPAPTSLDDLEAAAVLTGLVTAVSAIDRIARVRPGERVLVRGAAGGVGVYAVQLAALRGAQVIGLARKDRLDQVRRLGAAEALDYRRVNAGGLSAEVVIDTVGTNLLPWRRILPIGGRMVTTAFGSAAAMLSVAVSSIHGARRIRTFGGLPPRAVLEQATVIADSGTLQPVIAARFPLEGIAAAHAAFERGGTFGRLVINLERR